MSARRVLALFTFFYFAADSDTAYAAKGYFAPLGFVGTLLQLPIPYKIGVPNHIILGLIFFGASRRAEWVKPMVSVMKLAGATIVTEVLWGMLWGGTFQPAYWQVYYIWSGVLFGYGVAAVCADPRDYTPLLDAILYAAAYRAVMCVVYWIFYVAPHTWSTEYIMAHDDSVLEPAAIFIVLLRLLHGAPNRSRGFAYVLLQIAAMVCNNRRLVWLSFVSALVFLYFLVPPSQVKKRLTRAFAIVAPILAIYVAVGQGRTEPIFKPVASFSSTSGKEDNSTKARNVENLGLVATGLASNRLLGSGWGHPYIEVANWYRIPTEYFPLWPYVPHNSVLGCLAFTGILGFAGLWLAFPTAMFLNVRLARLGDSALVRQLGMLGALELVVVGYQMYGDMGCYYARPMYMIGLSYAFALRLPISAGVWPSARVRKPEPPPKPEDAGRVAAAAVS